MSAHELAPPRVSPPAGATRLLAGVGDGPSLAPHQQRWGELPSVLGERGRRDLVALVAASGLTGRGGGGFPTARKLEAVAAQRGEPIVVANGVEGEPVSGKDAVLLTYVPHLVLDGATVAAQAVGAREAVVAVGRSSLESAERAVAERRRAGLGRAVTLRVLAVPEGFVAGEETALVRFVAGGPAKPTFGALPFEQGVGGRPTLVQNTETLAHLGLVARFGPRWFRSVGSEDEPGSALVTLSGAVGKEGVYEAPTDVRLDALLAHAGGASHEVEAVLVGGYFGSWLPAAAAFSTPLSRTALLAHGAAPGARAVVVLPSSACGLAETARVTRWLAGESAGQCGPCVHGLAAIAGDLEDIAACHDAVAARRRLDQRLEIVSGRGACRHPDGAVRFVLSALRVFPAELDRHIRRGRCSGRHDGYVLPVPAGPRR